MASFIPANSPDNLTMIDFQASLNALGGPAKQCRFAVRIMPAGQNNILTKLGYSNFIKDMTMFCDATELPGRGFDLSEVRYYGPSITFPRNSKYSEGIEMSFMCRTQSFERQMFDDWMEVVNPTNIYDFNYPKDYYAEIQVFQLAEFNSRSQQARSGQAVYSWSLHKAWPMLVSPQPVTWADDNILRLSVTFAYQSWTRPGRDTQPGGSPIQP